MAKRSRMSVLKRQRELKKAEKAARKRAKRHGSQEGGFTEPQPTVRLADLARRAEESDDEESDDETRHETAEDSRSAVS